MNNALIVRNVSKTFDKFKLDNISFEVPGGSIVGVIGKNGCGKSTLLSVLMGMKESDSTDTGIVIGGARRVYGFVEDDNLRSKRLCKRLGMRYERCMKEFISFVCYPDGTPRYEDTCIYAILNKEWTEQREQKPNSLGLCRVVTDMHEMNEKKQ